MKISFINVGYGDSILIENSTGSGTFTILVDGGGAEKDNYDGFPQRIRAADYLKLKGIKKINLLILTHLHEDHAGGLLDVAKAFEIDELWCSYVFPEELRGMRLSAGPGYDEDALRLINSLNAYNEIVCILMQNRKKIEEVRGTGLDLKIADGVFFDVFGPGDGLCNALKAHVGNIYSWSEGSERRNAVNSLNSFINDTSLVIRVKHGDRKILLAADACGVFWKDLLERGRDIRADLLKQPHHGRMDGVSEEFVRAVNPGTVVISVSNGRPDGGPASGAIELIRKCCENDGKKVEFFFTDAADMPPYSMAQPYHRAVVFEL